MPTCPSDQLPFLHPIYLIISEISYLSGLFLYFDKTYSLKKAGDVLSGRSFLPISK
jgi:hypothetical protein